MRIKKWLGMENKDKAKAKAKDKTTSSSHQRLNPHVPPRSKHVKKKLGIQKDQEVERLQSDISKLSEEVKRNNEYISMLAKGQLEMVRNQKNSSRRTTAVKVFRKGMESLSAKPISKEEFRKKAFSTEYLDRTAPRRRSPTQKGG